MAGRGFRRVRTAIDRLDPHPLHQRCDMPAADLARPRGQKIAQHPAPRERELQMQLVDLPHEVAGRLSETGRGR